MKMIKYHDNYKEPKYVDHKLSNNWNPDDNYKENDYVHVHFRINCPSYHLGFENPKAKELFSTEKLNVFRSIGWKCDNPEFCMEVVKGNARLYLHPQDFSGIVLKRDVKQIAEALDNNITFSLNWVDIYENVYDISNEEYENYLNAKRDETKKKLYVCCKTTRTYRYHWCSDITYAIAKQISLPRVGCSSVYKPNKEALAYVDRWIDELADEGYLVTETRNNIKYVRSRNKTELKRLKLKEIVA